MITLSPNTQTKDVFMSEFERQISRTIHVINMNDKNENRRIVDMLNFIASASGYVKNGKRWGVRNNCFSHPSSQFRSKIAIKSEIIIIVIMDQVIVTDRLFLKNHAKQTPNSIGMFTASKIDKPNKIPAAKCLLWLSR